MFLTINISALQSKNLTLSEVALFIVRDHLSNLTSTIVLAEKGMTPESTINNTLLLEYILQNLNGKIAIQSYMTNYSEQPFEYYVFIVDSLEAFRELHNDFKDSLFERHFRFIIVLTQQTQNLRNAMQQIFVLCHSFDVIDVNIIVHHQILGVAMFTYYLYSETVCRRCVPILLHNCNQGIENLKLVFPEKLTNLHGCPFRVSGRSFAPYVRFKGNRNDPKPVGAWENLNGIEGALLKFLAKSLNFTIDLQPIPAEGSFYNINHTSGCFSQLLEKKADIVIGGFIDSSLGRMIFSPTNTYHSSHFKYVIQGKIDVNSLDRLIKPFNSVLWCLFKMVNIKRCVLFYFITWPLKTIETAKIHWPTVEVDNDSIELAEITLNLTRKFLKYATSTLVIVEKSVTPETSNTNLNLLEYFLQNVQDNIAVQLKIHSKNKQPWEYYIFIVDSIEAFRKINGLFPESFFERHFYFLIILTKHTHNLGNVIEDIFKLCYQFNVIDVILIVKHPTDGVCMFTYMLYSTNACRTVQPILYLRLKDNRELDNLKTIFPEKLNNFFGCPVKVAGRKLGPFLDLRGNKNNPQPVGSWENLSGVEGLLIRELASALNFQLQLLPFPKSRSYIENLTCYGSFLELQNGNADLAIGGFGGSDPSRWLFTPSIVYHSSPFVYVVRAKELSAIGRLAKPFSIQLWIALVGVLAIGFSFIIILRFMNPVTTQYILGDKNDAPTLNFFAIILGYPVNRTPLANRNFARYILLLLLILTLVIRNAYQGSLYEAILRDGFVRIPSGLKEIVKWNYKILISPEVDKFNAYPKDLTITVPVGGYLARIKILEKIEGRYASAILRESFIDYMNKNQWKRNNLFMNNEVIIMYHFVMFFPKNSIYVATFDKKLRLLIYGGITNKLKHNNLTSEAALRSIRRSQPPREPLGNRRLRAMYDIYICMKVIAIFVFFLELMSVRCDKLYRFFQWIS
ncbi:uncharacterized protein LOC129944881 [Eupeodes corollae]|uniref:uncharacterized protein LOC129944881 n=1 Tax=Eupeodes corollae TaxID=290404 RepID=UPI002492CB1F|nr:uncharacterized protein LOC129944881 [Eupeodes corollae]